MLNGGGRGGGERIWRVGKERVKGIRREEGKRGRREGEEERERGRDGEEERERGREGGRGRKREVER